MDCFPALNDASRVMVLAPHPDDEAIAAGALVQLAAASGAAVRIVFATNGDNNPWPQRIMERKLRIGAGDRIRWGMRRHAESLDSLAVLGVSPDNAVFWGFPDQELTGLVMRTGAVLERLTSELNSFGPTVLVAPSPEDLHPDHSALGLLTRLGSSCMRGRHPLQLEYVVHAPRPANGAQNLAGAYARALNGLFRFSPEPATDLAIRLRLTALQRERKAMAILCHCTQMLLGRRRFLAASAGDELFKACRPPLCQSDTHPVRDSWFEGKCWHLKIAAGPRHAIFGRAVLHIISGRAGAGWGSYSIALPASTGPAVIFNALSGAPAARAYFRGTRAGGNLLLSAAQLLPARRAFVKLAQRYVFLDAAGWREVPAFPLTAEAGAPEYLAAA
jgi:LmbE family N-acetylglucosaminyl deacetylase